ncbi:MAG: radical SAM protein [Isosphaeraceae bacterium]
MATDVLTIEQEITPPALANRPELIRVDRRGPILRPSPRVEGVYGLDLTGGCLHGCPFCYLRGSARYPGEGRVFYDPGVAERLPEALDALGTPPRLVVLSPLSDPLPPSLEIRRATTAIVQTLLGRGIEVLVMTRGRVGPALVDVLAAHPGKAKVALGFLTCDPKLGKVLEPRAASTRARLRSLARLIGAGVDVEVRLEPLIPDLTDTHENLFPLFDALARAGTRRLIAHYLFQQPAMMTPLDEALAPLGRVERLADQFTGGPVFKIGSIGATKHLPLEARQAGLARLIVWGAEHSLTVETGSAQNPDLRRVEHAPVPPTPKRPKRATSRKAKSKRQNEPEGLEERSEVLQTV